MNIFFYFSSLAKNEPDTTNFSFLSNIYDNSERFSARNICAAEQHIFLVLIDRSWIRNRLVVFNYRNRLASQKRLVDSQNGRSNRQNSKISWNFVANCNFDKISGYEIARCKWLNREFYEYCLLFFFSLGSFCSILSFIFGHFKNVGNL